MANERPISKEHAEEIWIAVLAMTEQSQQNIFQAAEDLIATRHLLDQSVALQQMEKGLTESNARVRKELELSAAIQKWVSQLKEKETTAASSAKTPIEAGSCKKNLKATPSPWILLAKTLLQIDQQSRQAKAEFQRDLQAYLCEFDALLKDLSPLEDNARASQPQP